MRKAFAVARWEYVEKVKSKAFIISLVLMPAIMIAAGVVPTLLATRADTETRVIGIIDQSGVIAAPLGRVLAERYTLSNGRPNYILRSISPEGDSAGAKRTADSLLIAEQIEGYLVIGRSIMTDTTAEYHSENTGNIRLNEQLTRAVRDLVVERKLHAQGIDPSLVRQLTRPLDLRMFKLSKSGREEESGFERAFFTSYGFMMMMFILVITSGQLLVRSMLEEKANRVVEVLMSSSSAQDLMAGKILGLSALGLTQMGIWVLVGIGISLKFAVAFIPAASAALLFLYFLLGYLFYAAIFVAAGSPVSTEQEAQQITSYLVMVLVIPIALAFVVMQSPNSTLVKVLSLIPFLTPSMMALRIPLQMPPAGEIVLSLLVLALSALAAIWGAGKIFRATILLYGKRPGLRELVSIIRMP